MQTTYNDNNNSITLRNNSSDAAAAASNTRIVNNAHNANVFYSNKSNKHNDRSTILPTSATVG